MKVYELPRNAYFKLLSSDLEVPNVDPLVVVGSTYRYIRIDGAFGLCETLDVPPVPLKIYFYNDIEMIVEESNEPVSDPVIIEPVVSPEIEPTTPVSE